MLALGGLGVAYGHWVESLEIATTVNVGEGDPGFTGQYQFFQDAGDIDLDYGCTATFIDSDGDGDYDTMEATMTNVDASCSYKLYSTVHNEGTLPMRIDGVEIYNPDPDLVEIYEEETVVGAVLDPGAEVECKLYIAIGGQSLAEYSFSVEIISSLWNQ